MKIKTLNSKELELLFHYSKLEMWNIEKVHILSLFKAHPDDFFIAYEAGQLIGFIIAIKHTDKFGFISTFLVLKEHRGVGYGKYIFNHALKHLDGRQIALDSSLNDVKLYERYGFKSYFEVVNYTCISSKDKQSEIDIVDFNEKISLLEQDAYMKNMLTSKEVSYKAVMRDEKTSSFAFTYKYIDGYKIFIDTEYLNDAIALFVSLTQK